MGRQNKTSRGVGIGKAELEALEFVHANHPVTVRQVADFLAKSRGLVRTTALNVMIRLHQKGFLTRKRVEGVYQFSPKISRGTLMRKLVREFVEGTLGGSVSPFVAYLSSDADVSDEELAALRKLVEELGTRKESQ